MEHKLEDDFNLKIEQEWLNADLHTVQSEYVKHKEEGLGILYKYKHCYKQNDLHTIESCFWKGTNRKWKLNIVRFFMTINHLKPKFYFFQLCQFYFKQSWL